MQFMATITLDLTHRDDVERLLPAEGARVRELHQQGVLDALYVPEANGAPNSLWVVLTGISQEVVQHALESLPLYPFMQIQTTPLRSLNLSA